MGWDAFANNRRDCTEFRAIARIVRAKAGTVDGGLAKGGLDCRDCGRALHKATGRQVYDEDGWDWRKVIRLANEATWPTLCDVPREDWSSVLSAKAFLLTCAKLRTGIWFGW